MVNKDEYINHLLTYLLIYYTATPRVKKVRHQSFVTISSMLTIFAIKRSLHITLPALPHRKRVATLPCEILMAENELK